MNKQINKRRLCSPAHDLLELLAGQEARVLPDLPQGALVLPLELVLQTLPLLLLLGVAALLPIVQPAGTEPMTSLSGRNLPLTPLLLDRSPPSFPLTLRPAWA